MGIKRNTIPALLCNWAKSVILVGKLFRSRAWLDFFSLKWPFMLCYVMLCYVMLCYAMLCYAMLCYAMLCYAMLWFAMLCFAMLCYVMLCYAMLCFALLCFAMLCYAMLCYAMLCYAMLCYVMFRKQSSSRYSFVFPWTCWSVVWMRHVNILTFLFQANNINLPVTLSRPIRLSCSA